MDFKSSVKLRTREEVMDQAYELGYTYEMISHYCPQASMAALMDVFGIRSDILFRSLFAFHGGGGNRGIGMCGALVGGIAAVSFFYGRSRQEFDLAVQNTRATEPAKILIDRFEKEFGGIRCRDCQKKMFGREFDFWNEEDRRAFEEEQGHDKCAEVVGKGASLAAGLLWDELHATDV